ncbi:MAG: response regulator [Anaerolineae bacterium]|nr:response regulator [Anaerolineae bacterium]
MQPTIMIVDDDEQILVLVEILLRRQGYIVLKAPTPYAALEILQETTPDLCLLDYMMPGMNGLELCEQIRQHPTAGKIPVVMLSAVDTDEFISNSRAAGANGHISKAEMHRRLTNEVNQYLPAKQAK